MRIKNKILISLFIVGMFASIPAIAEAADRYWIGNSGNWNDTAKWSDSSGGAGGQSVPSTSDTAYVDAASLSAASTITINATASVVDLIITGLDQQLDIRMSANLTCSGTCQINGQNATSRVFVRSDTLGTARTITAATTTVTNADFRDITGAGAGSWDLSTITGGSGNGGGNTNITFTTADDWYWHADTGNVSDYTKWYTVTNGGGSQMASTSVPLPQDTLHFDSSSFDSASQTITQNMPRIGSIDFTGATNTPTFTTSIAASVFGSVTLISGMTLTASTQAYIFEGRGSYTLDSGGLTWEKNITILAPGGTLTLSSNLIMGNIRVLTLTNGTFSAVNGVNNYNVTAGRFLSSDVTTRTLTMGSGTWESTGDSNGWSTDITTGLTITSNTATIKITGAFTAGRSFYTGSANFNGASLWNASTGNYSLTIVGSGVFNDIKIDAGRTVKFTAGTTTTLTTLTAVGASTVITSATAATHTLSASSGTIAVQNSTISYSVATGGATWNAFTSLGNVDGGNNSGWVFTEPPPPGVDGIRSIRGVGISR